MDHQFKERIEQAFQLTSDLVTHLDENHLNLDLPNLPSNRVSGQLWCIVGARESYAKALMMGSLFVLCMQTD